MAPGAIAGNQLPYPHGEAHVRVSGLLLDVDRAHRRRDEERAERVAQGMHREVARKLGLLEDATQGLSNLAYLTLHVRPQRLPRQGGKALR
jgi:hypothetical protein